MKSLKQPAWILSGAVICLFLAACGKISSSPKMSPAAARQFRLDWNLKTTVEAYQDIGSTDPSWDQFATNALTEFARVRAQAVPRGEPWLEIIRTNAAAAINAGCDDPMVNYLFIKYAMSQQNSKTAFLDAFSKMDKNMNQSAYPPVRKFYAAARTLDQIFYTYGTNAPNQPIEAETTTMLNDSFKATLADKTMPGEEAYEVADLMLYLMSGDADRYAQAYDFIEKPLFENWPDESASWLLKGEAYIKMAWDARGNGYANSVSKEQWKTFAKDLSIAEKSLERAWKLNPADPRIPYEMMSVELGQGQGRDRMELWFNRAMQLNPNDYEACSAKLYYLEPKWYGSTNDMLDFGRECVQSANWGGRVPLILVSAHYNIYNEYLASSERRNYWKQPAVWADIQSAYEKFFQINPNVTGNYRAYYAWYAYQAEDWDTLNELIPQISPDDYYVFGGKDEFDRIAQLAKEHAAASTAATPQ